MKIIKLPQFNRQKFILALLQIVKKEISRTNFQKYLFIINQEYNKDEKYYHFLPYHYGPFSFQAYADLRRLSKLGHVNSDSSIKLINKFDFLSTISVKDRSLLENFYNTYKNLKDNDLLSYVYKNYPYYTLKSKIRNQVINKTKVKIDYSHENENIIFTLGYEGLTIDQYLNILIKNDVKMLIDVRNNPVSMKYGFSKKFLMKILPELNIDYIHIPELGIKSSKRQNLSTKIDYLDLFFEYKKVTLYNQKSSLQSIKNYLNKKIRIALTCFEKDSNFCHRSCVSEYLENYDKIKIVHL